MADELKNKKVAILVTDGFEEVELTKPRQALEEAGAKTQIVSPKSGSIKAWNHTEWGEKYEVDTPLSETNAGEFDALLLPGGVINGDHLRTDDDAVQFASRFMESGKPVAVICHGPWILIETGKVKGKKMTSYPSLKTDLENAGAHWVNEEVVTDNGLVSSRKPDDIPAFNKKMIEEIREGVHERAAAM
ncbi:MAG TPA: type 1 glutamine amidotransferase domain-containing protein [Balneolaceae bacterium]|nr:type 1 glutamine amidotransferase domain-containing protein [Balneolaceae bacterium]